MKSSKERIIKKIGSCAKTLSIAILDGLLGFAENAVKISMSRKEAYRIAYGYVEQEWTVDNLHKFFYGLERQGYIKKTKDEAGSDSIIFTEKARMALLEQISARLNADGKFRYVSFDIPEQMRRQRNAFRRAIKKIGFKQIQKSLWATNKNVGDLVELAAYEFEVEKYITYIVGEKSDIDGYIEKLFQS